MEIGLFVKGALLGFSIAAPVGPVGVLCIRRTLQNGRFSGLVSGLGAAAADTFYGCIAAFSLTLVSNFLMEKRFYLHLIGGIFLIFLGGKTFFAKTKEITAAHVPHRSFVSDFISTFFLTISNPLTLFSFVAIFAALGLVNVSEKYIDASILVAGIFTGAAAWWLFLSEGMTFFRKRVSQQTMTWINRIAGMIIVAFGLAALISLLHI